MKKVHLIILSCLFVQSAFSAVDKAKTDTDILLPQVGKPILSVWQENGLVTRADNQAVYAYPDGLSRLGTYSSDNQPVCNYLSPNRLTNGTYFLWAPLDKQVTYISNVTDAASYNWIMPGTSEETSSSVNASATYTKLGHYPFPSLELTDASGGKSTYRADGELLVSGKAEITTADCRKWGETYQLGYLPLNGGTAGYLGGTNSANLKGYGNLFMTAHGNAHITGVNVYFAFKPTKYDTDAKLLLRVWYPMESESGMEFTGLPLEVVELPVSEIRDAYEGEFPIKNVAVGEFRFEKPLQIWDKPLFFVTVEGFGDDPSKSDIVMLTEVMGQEIPEEHMTNLLAHNSFVDYDGMGYSMPINYFGAKPGSSFMICPIVDNKDGDATGIFSAVNDNSETEISVNALQLTVSNGSATAVNVLNACGMKIDGRNVGNGQSACFSLPGKGVYFVQVMCNGRQTDVRKVLIK